MKDLAIFGAGGFGREVASMIRTMNQENPTWNIVGFFVDGGVKGTPISNFGEVLGGIEELNNWNKPLAVAIAIGTPSVLKNVRERIYNPNVYFPNIIYPDFMMLDPDSITMGEGNIITRGCGCTCNVTIGNFNILNGNIGLGHDDVLGNYNVIMPSAHISGGVTMKECNLIGVGAIILQQIKIGSYVNVGAGAVLLSKPKDSSTYIGNPAKLFKY